MHEQNISYQDESSKLQYLKMNKLNLKGVDKKYKTYIILRNATLRRLLMMMMMKLVCWIIMFCFRWGWKGEWEINGAGEEQRGADQEQRGADQEQPGANQEQWGAVTY